MAVNENGWIWNALALSHRCYYTILFLEGVRKTMNKLTRDTRHPGRLLNPGHKTISSGKKESPDFFRYYTDRTEKKRVQ